MKTIKFHLEGGLSDSDLRQIHAEVLQVLEKIGVECDHTPTLERLAGEEDITIHNKRVRFSPNLVNKYIEKVRNSNSQRKDKIPEEVTVSGPWNCFNIEDMETGRIRSSTAKDVQEMFKLLSVAKAGPISPVYPTDIEPRLQLLYLEKTGIELTEAGGGSGLEFSDRKMREFAIEMYKAAGRKYWINVQFPISPLRLDPGGLEIIWEYMNRDDVFLSPGSAPIPQAGLTAPMFVPGALVQAVSETLAGCIVVDKISEGKINCPPFYRIELFDMRYMVPVYASPEHIQYQLLIKDVHRYFSGVPMTSHYFCCNAKQSDLQAMLERTSWIITLSLAGFRHFWCGAGQLSMDETFSPAQFIVDQEIAKYATHLIQGIEYEDQPAASFDVINQVGPGGNFLTHKTTLDNLRKQFESDLFPRTNVGQWRAAGEPDIWKKAVEKAKMLIESYKYRLNPSVQKEIDRIYSEANKYIAKK